MESHTQNVLAGRELRHHVTEKSASARTADADGEAGPSMQTAARVDRYRRALEATLGVPFTTGNHLEVLRNGDEIFPAMLEAIESAQQTIDFLTYVYWTGDIAIRFADALSRKAREGLSVDVILDAYGAKTMDRALVKQMQDAGVTVAWFRPPSWRIWRLDNRTHRKILVCDGKIAFTGGVGVAKEWEGDARNPSEWRDTHFRLEGPAVHGVHAAFLGNWAEMGRTIRLRNEEFPKLEDSGDAAVMSLRSVASIGWSDVATIVQVLIQLARERLRVQTPYFVPDRDTRQLLCEAAERGVEVEIQVPGPHIDENIVRKAAQADYGPLLDAGVRINRYTRTMLHTKCITVDGVLACVGSANFNHRSLRKDDEFCLAILHPQTVAKLDEHFDQDLDACEAVDLEKWRHRGAWQKFQEWLVRCFDPQL